MVVYKVPVASQWNNASIDTVTPDGGFVYTGAKSINYIGPIADRKQQAVIKTINTRQSILSLDVDPGWAAEPPEVAKKYVAVLAYDNSVQIWDLDLELAICGHKVHQYSPGIVEYSGPGGADFNQNRIVALLSFMKNRNVLSLDENNLVNYCIASNTYQNMPNFIQKRNQRFSALRCSPYDEEIFAVGTNRGSVYLCNLKKSQVVYTLRGHDTIITCMKFICTETYSLERLKQQIHAQHQRQQQQHDQADHKQHKLQKEKNPKLKQLKGGGNAKGGPKASAPPAQDQDEIFDIYDYDYLENEFGAPPQQTDEIVSDFVGFEKPQPTAEFDFAEACQNLKHELAAMSIDDQSQEPAAKSGCEVTLEDCKNSNVRYDDTSSCDDDDEEDHKRSSSHKGDAADEAEAGSSLELIEHKSNNSSDEGIGGDEERKCKKQISLQADVHAIGEPIAMDDDGDNCASNAGIDGMSCEPDAAERRNSLNNIHVSDVLLATSSLDAQIWLWNIRTGVPCDNVQMPGSVQRGKSCHVQACWLNSNSLVATNKNGDLFCYALETPQVHNIKQRYKLKPIKHMFDSHGIVSFDACTGKEMMWTVSRNREIKLESFQTQQLLAKYGCASTNINAIRENPQDMNKVAVGFSDRRFGVIDLSRLEPNTVIISNQSLRIESPIHCVVWSPDGTRLAFGSEEGRIGIADVPRQPHREVIYLNPICGRPVYSMDWHKTDIYVVCNEMIGVYGNDGKKKHPEIIENIKKVSTISIHPAGYLLVGKQTGKLEIYKRHNPGSITSYELLQTLDLAPRYITEISWNPIVSNRFGVVANANYVHILDFNPETGNATQIHKLMAVDNPKSCNACLRWSNIDAEKFLTCGFDGAVRVWNLKLEGDKKFDFVKYYPCPIVCGIFMPTDENIVICAGKSTSLEMFDLREEKSQAMCKRFRDPLSSVQWAQEAMMCSKPPSTSEKKRMKRQKAALAANPAVVTVAAGEQQKETGKQILMNAGQQEDIVVVTVNEQLQQMHIAGEPQTIDDELNVTLKDAGGVYSKNPASVLCLITREMNKFPLEKLKKLLVARNGPSHSHIDSVLSTKLFGDKELAKKLLVHELENHHASGSKGVQHIFLPQLTQNFKEEILKAITQKKLNEWHVSMAPSVSYNFWQKTAQAFADQLLEQGFTLQAATYLISLHKHSDAITMLTDGKYYKEAMLLARIYLDKDDPLIASIMEKWLAYLDSTGNLFTAAFICALANDSKRCLEIISKVAKRTDDIEEIIKLLKSS